MRIAIIDVKRLTKVRETFRPGPRLLTAIVFLLSVFFWFAGLHQLRSLSTIIDDAAVRTRGLILAAVILPLLAAALPRKNDFSRLFFALAILLNLLTITILILVGASAMSTSRGAEQAFYFIFLLVLFFLLVYQVGPCYVLLLSLIPFGRWKAFREQVRYSLHLWAGEWKGPDEPQQFGAGERHRTKGTPYRMAVGWVSLAFGAVTFLATLFSLVNREFVPAVRRLELSRAWQMVSGFQTTPPGDWSDVAYEAADTLIVLLVAFFFFFLFGFFRTQWQRENVVTYRTPLLQHMTSSDLLLLRSFSDDAKYVGRTHGNWMLMFRVYAWSFTFEQLIVNRLKYLGEVRLVDIRHERKELLEKGGVRFVARVVGGERLKRFLAAVFPAVWHRLPAKGGVRYYIEAAENDEGKWKAEVGQAMSLARMIVMVLGTTDSLRWEMGQIEERSLSEKTLFVMPPLIRKKSYRERWQRFTDIVCASRDCDRRVLGQVNPRRVLAVVLRADTLVIITSKRTLDTFYESALDVATILTVAGPGLTAKLVPKYLD
jgi:hypothetical protein